MFRRSVGIACWLLAQHFLQRCSDLSAQVIRASQSVVLNLAEGAARGGPAGRYHFDRGRIRIALGSTAEVSAVLDLVDRPDVAVRPVELQRVGAMLRGLTR